MAESLTTVSMTPAQLAQWQQMQSGDEIRMDPAKAAALDTWLAQGGGVRKRGSREGAYRAEFRRGPMKGMTVDEAKQKFERMWEGASPAVRAKYEQRAKDVPAPVSGNAANGARPGESMPDYYKRIGMAPVTAVQKPDTMQPGTSKIVQGPPRPTTVSSPGGDQSQAAMGTPEQQAQVRAMMGENEQFQTAYYGGAGVDVAALNAAREASDKKTAQERAIKSGAATPEELAPVQQADQAKSAAEGQSMREQYVRDQQAAADRKRAEERAAAGLLPVETAVPTSPLASPTVQTAAEARVAKDTAEILARSGNGNPSDPVPLAPEAVARQAPAPTTPVSRINPLTGLPFGYRPGDVVPAANQAAADASVQRQTQATNASTPAMRAGADNAMRASGMVVPRTPVQAPPVRPAGRADGYKAPSIQDDMNRERETAAARQSGTMGDYFTSQGKPEMAKAFPNKTANPAGLVAKPPTGIQSPFGSIRKPITPMVRPARFALARR